jgi:serine phosphatase RsbU (regulator of sigma subunit)
MPQREEGPADRTTIFRRDDTLPAEAQEEVGHYLVVLSGTGLGRRFRLEAEPVTIGRDPACGFVISSPDVSRRHCRLQLVADEIFATDLNSTNGTYIDGKRIVDSTPLPDGSTLEIGQQVLKHERRSTREVMAAQELDRDLEKARNYVLSLLPPPITGGPIQAEWFIVPSAKVGGDAFGYGALDADQFVSYLIDVSGHGVGAAMLSVSILNVLRQRALPATDFGRPAEVLARLNAMFQMENHNGMFFTIWYGVYRLSNRMLSYASGGHHPAYLVSSDRTKVVPLKTMGPLIGVAEDYQFEEATVHVPSDGALHIFSDGVFEIADKHNRQLGLSDFLPLLQRPAVEGRSEPQRLYQTVRAYARQGPLDDDFSYLVVKLS